MTTTRISGWDDLEPSMLSELGTDEFEHLCADLIHAEAVDRFDPFDFEAPSGGGVKDGGRDILLTVHGDADPDRRSYARRHSLRPLIEDSRGATAYSCKTGQNWFKLIVGEIDRERKEPFRPVEVLMEGGHFKLLIDQVGRLDRKRTRNKKEATSKEHIALALLEQMKKIDPTAADPSDRIEIVDADRICRFLRGRQPENLDRWLERLGLQTQLLDLNQWKAWHNEDRSLPSYVPDGLREDLRTSIVEFLALDSPNPAERIAWVVGAPGSGKTRLLLETLGASPVAALRVRYSPDAEEVARLLGSHLLSRHRASVIVVDDCPSGLVDRLSTLFIVHAEKYPHAQMVVITAVAPEHATKPPVRGIERRWELQSLDETAMRTLVSAQLGEPEDSTRVSDIVRLCEGYPWYAALLAREAIDSDTHPRTAQAAAQLGLASGAEVAQRENIRLLRARALLAATLTKKVDWDRLDDQQAERFCRGVGLSSLDEAKQLAQGCVERGILRRREWAYKYVTPLVLEREILSWLLGPGGDDPGGRRLLENAHELAGELFETILKLELPADLVREIAELLLEALRRAPMRWSQVVEVGLSGAALMFVARYLPGPAASEVRRRIEACDIEELRSQQDGRRHTVFALEELSSRKDSFEDAEAALFRLALAENESWANNASGVWAGLFDVSMNVTHRSARQRFGLLQRRLEAPAPEGRMLALTGLRVAIDQSRWRTVPKNLDGLWSGSTFEETFETRSSGWSLLAARFADDNDEVAGRAKKYAIELLRGAVRRGEGEVATAAIAAGLDCFDDMERAKLAEALDAVRRYDSGYVAPDAEQLKTLERMLAPKSFHDRLTHHVGVWPDSDHQRVLTVDESIAVEGLSGDIPVTEELDWLVSEEAVRGLWFALAVGKVDTRGVLLDELLARAQSERGARFIANYLEGWCRSERRAEAMAVIESIAEDADRTDAFALSLINVGADNDDQVRVLVEGLADERFGQFTLYEIGRREPTWVTGTSEQAQETLVATLVSHETVNYAAPALELILGLVKQDPERIESLREYLMTTLNQLSQFETLTMTNHYWQKAASLLVDEGEAARIAELAVSVIADGKGGTDHAWKALRSASARDPSAAWLALSKTLEKADRRAGKLVIEFKFNRGENLPFPPEEVLEWVGDDEWRGRRAAELVRPQDDQLPPIFRGLVLRFGAHSSVANSVANAFHQTNGLVASLAAHSERQLRRVEAWFDDPEPKVAQFARRLAAELEKSLSKHAAWEEIERREMGS